MSILLISTICHVLLFQHAFAIKPSFGPMPTSYTVREGSRAVLKCQVKDLGTKTVVWRRTDSDFPLTIGLYTFVRDYRIASDFNIHTDTWTLTIEDVIQEDKGTYQCAVSSGEGTDIFNVELKIGEGNGWQRPSFGPMPSSYSVEEGSKAVLQCQVFDLGANMVSWRRANEPNPLTVAFFTFVADSRISVSFDNSNSIWNLVISEVRPEDAGTYICSVSSDTSLDFNVDLQVKVSEVEQGSEAFLAMPTSYTVAPSRTAILQCKVRNPGAGEVFWTRGSVILTFGTNRIVDDPRLTAEKSDINTWNLVIHDVQTSDAGTYSCHQRQGEPFDVQLRVVS